MTGPGVSGALFADVSLLCQPVGAIVVDPLELEGRETVDRAVAALGALQGSRITQLYRDATSRHPRDTGTVGLNPPFNRSIF